MQKYSEHSIHRISIIRCMLTFLVVTCCLLLAAMPFADANDAPLEDNGMYANASTGIAKLRRDGFASMDAGSGGGTLTTKPVLFSGNRLFVNVDCPIGRLRVEVLDENSQPLEGFSAARCRASTADSTLSEVTWEGDTDLSSLAGTPVRFRFHLDDGQLYSFWVSPNASGASNGYVAGGGPGFDGAIDTVGKSAYLGKDRLGSKMGQVSLMMI